MILFKLLDFDKCFSNTDQYGLFYECTEYNEPLTLDIAKQKIIDIGYSCFEVDIHAAFYVKTLLYNNDKQYMNVVISFLDEKFDNTFEIREQTLVIRLYD